MKAQEKDIDLIIRFFDLSLSDAELTAFEKRLFNDSEFENKVKTYKEANNLVNDKYQTENDQLRIKKWDALLNKKVAVKSSKNISWKWIGSIAAGCLLIFSIWQYNIFQDRNMEQLVVDSWDKNVGLGSYTSRSAIKDAQQENLVKAYLAYKDKEYKEAIAILQSFKATGEYEKDMILIKALSKHGLGDSKSAIQLLSTLNKNKTSDISKIARWYIGLIYFDLDDEVSAKKFLELPKDKTSEIRLKE